MELPPFLLDHWLARYEFATPPIRFNLASSTGPRWTVGEVLALGPGTSIDGLGIGYAPPEGHRALREAVAAFHGVDPDWVVITTGASEALLIMLCLAAEPGAGIALASPAFPAFEAMAGAWGLAVRNYPLDQVSGFRQTAAGVLSAVDDDTSIALVNTPHNPTGSIMPREEVVALAGALSDRGIPLLVDEVYHPLYFGPAVPSAASIPNVVVMSDMSKALSLPGLRLGWLIDADAARRNRIIDARSYFTISSSPIGEAIATHALRNHRAITDRLEAIARPNLAAFDAFMAKAAGELSWVRPGGGTVCFPWFVDGRDSRPFCQALAESGVLVAPGDCFGRPAHMRVGFGAQADEFGEALEIFGRTLGEFR